MNEKALFKIVPLTFDKIWGYEQWLFSTLKNAESFVVDPKKNIPLSEKLGGKDFPLLIKIIQADETLSVQVHPNDEYAQKNENSSGKTECWYILDAQKDAKLVCGLNGHYNRGILQKAIEENKLEEYLFVVPVQKGDFIFIPAGTVHAIQGGLRILEIQQASDVTYRLYDWGRKRELHVQKSLDVIENAFAQKNKPFSLPQNKFSGVFSCPFFTVEKIDFKTGTKIDILKNKSDSIFVILEGEGFVKNESVQLELKKEDVFFASANQALQCNGNFLLMHIRAVL